MENAVYILDKEKFGIKVRLMRTEQKGSQEILATNCNVDVRTIQRIEKGEQNLSIELLFALSNGLKISPDELIKSAIKD